MEKKNIKCNRENAYKLDSMIAIRDILSGAKSRESERKREREQTNEAHNAIVTRYNFSSESST